MRFDVMISPIGVLGDLLRRNARRCGAESSTQATHCHACGAVLIGRDWYDITAWQLSSDGRCVECGTHCRGVFEAVAGQWGPRRQPMRLQASEPEPIVPRRTL
jgi:hypothetical protein